MNKTKQTKKVEYGDFQTPLYLAEKICYKLAELNVEPDLIIEPTCGIGNFINASSRIFPSTKEIIGLEINQNYLQKIYVKNPSFKEKKIKLIHGNFFDFNWISLIEKNHQKILILGNFPWVTNSQQGMINTKNLPPKNNFQKHSGLDAITGKSNFDISEWMLIQCVDLLQNHSGYIAMICKTTVARKILNYIHSNNLNLSYFATYKIDTKKYFNVGIEAGLLFCQFEPDIKQYFCDVFSNFDTLDYDRIGFYKNRLIRDSNAFEKLKTLDTDKSNIKWRSGIKHDCSNVMEFRKIDGNLINGFGEVVDIEDTYLFPLLKGSNVANGQTKNTNKYVLVTQRFIGEATENIKQTAPKTWEYLETHAKYLDIRKSKIYHKNPRFSIFGVGSYTFKPWKIAICGLYKKLDFKLVGKISEKPAIFDDTVYFISFEDQEMANKISDILNSTTVIDFYSSLIFWDEKRPIKSSILNRLNIELLLNDRTI